MALDDYARGVRRSRPADRRRNRIHVLDLLDDKAPPVGGRWSFDADNREPPPADGGSFPEPLVDGLDDLDREVMAAMPVTATGAAPYGLWATDRVGALRRLDHFVDVVRPDFGAYEDAMLSDDWHLAHSLLSPHLNMGLLLSREV